MTVCYPCSKFITHHWVGLYSPLRSLDRTKARCILLVNFWINWMGPCTKASTWWEAAVSSSQGSDAWVVDRWIKRISSWESRNTWKTDQFSWRWFHWRLLTKWPDYYWQHITPSGRHWQVSQTSFGHISINSSSILTVSMATESPWKDLSIGTSHVSRQSIMAEILGRSTGNHHGTIY